MSKKHKVIDNNVPVFVPESGENKYSLQTSIRGSSIKSVASDLMQFASPMPGASQKGAASMSLKANFGEHPLSRAGIEADKSFGKLLQKR